MPFLLVCCLGEAVALVRPRNPKIPFLALMIDPLSLIHRYYPEDNALRQLLIHHSQQVARHAQRVAAAHPELFLDADFLYRGAMLHDIGIFLTDAPGIHCHGTAPYIIHGRLGAELLRREDDPEAEALARVCERHTGTGLTAQTIIERQIPLPPADYRPETLEEQVICYADKFYSKSHPERERTYEQTLQSLARFGEEGVSIFKHWHALFG